jgi:hypothetical protein
MQNNTSPNPATLKEEMIRRKPSYKARSNIRKGRSKGSRRGNLASIKKKTVAALGGFQHLVDIRVALL